MGVVLILLAAIAFFAVAAGLAIGFTKLVEYFDK